MKTLCALARVLPPPQPPKLGLVAFRQGFVPRNCMRMSPFSTFPIILFGNASHLQGRYYLAPLHIILHLSVPYTHCTYESYSWIHICKKEELITQRFYL